MAKRRLARSENCENFIFVPRRRDQQWKIFIANLATKNSFRNSGNCMEQSSEDIGKTFFWFPSIGADGREMTRVRRALPR